MSPASERKPLNPFKKEGLFNGASPLVFQLAKSLRKNMTNAEELLWNYLKNGVYGRKFRRQHPVGIYIADFYCHKLKLLIEVDGSINNIPEIHRQDILREEELSSWGYNIIRFNNDDIIRDTESVLRNIEDSVQNLSEKIKL